jgi:hypothetical protein
MNVWRSIRFIRKPLDNFVKPCTRPEARVILPMGSCCWTYWCTIEIACIHWSKTTSQLLIVQAMLSVVLVSGATMLARNLKKLEHQDFGYQTQGRVFLLTSGECRKGAVNSGMV